VKATGGPDSVPDALTLSDEDEEGATEVVEAGVEAENVGVLAGTAAVEVEAPPAALGMGRVTPAEAQSWRANASVSVGLLVWM
jgi:hypothetical protein